MDGPSGLGPSSLGPYDRDCGGPAAGLFSAVVLLAGKTACWLAVFCAGVDFSSLALSLFVTEFRSQFIRGFWLLRLSLSRLTFWSWSDISVYSVSARIASIHAGGFLADK